MAETEAPSNSSSSSSNCYDHHRGFDDKALLTELELNAAQQLMQLSESSSSSSSGCESEKRRRSCNNIGVEDKEEGDDDVEHQSQLSVITCAKIKEIFGEEDVDDEVQDFQPINKKKKKTTTRYRLLADIYLATKPISR